MNPIRPSAFTPSDFNSLSNTTDPIPTARRRSSGSIQAAAASQAALDDIGLALTDVGEKFEHFTDVGITMADDLSALVSVRTDARRISAFDAGYASIINDFQDIEPDLEDLGIRFSRQKKDLQNIASFVLCKRKLEDNLQSQQLMQSWKVIADCMTELKTSFVDQQQSAHCLKIIGNLPKDLQETPKFIEQARSLDTKIKASLDDACIAHRALLNAVEAMLRKLDESVESENDDSKHYEWAQECHFEMWLDLMNATVAALSGAANSLHKYVDPSLQEAVVSLYPIVAASGTIHPDHDKVLKELLYTLRKKISGHALFERTIGVVESCKSLKEYLEKSPASSTDIVARRAVYNKLFEIGTTDIPRLKSDDLFNLIYLHQAHIAKLMKAKTNPANSDAAFPAPVTESDVDAAVEAYFAEMQFATIYIKAVVADGKVSEPELTVIKDRLGNMMLTSASQRAEKADASHLRLRTKTNEMQGKLPIDPADAEELAEMYLSFVRGFHGAAMALFENAPKFDDVQIIQEMARVHPLVLRQTQGTWECALSFNEATIGRQELASQILDTDGPLARAYGEIRSRLSDIGHKALPYMSTDELIHFEQMMLEANRYETNLNILNLQAHAAKPNKDFNSLIGKTIAHGISEVKRELGLFNATQARFEALIEAQRQGRHVDELEMHSARSFPEAYQAGSVKMQQRVRHWMAIAMLNDHPQLLNFYTMIRDQYSRVCSEIEKLNALPPRAENESNDDVEPASDSELLLLNDLSQLESDIRLLNRKFKKKFDVQGPNRKAEFEPALLGLKELESSVKSLMHEATEIIGIDPAEQQPVPADHRAKQTWQIEPDAVEAKPDFDAVEPDIEKLTAGIGASHVSRPTPALLTKMKNEMAQRDKVVSELLSFASGWLDFGRELAEEGCNRSHTTNNFNKALELQVQAAGLLDINETISKSFFSTPAARKRDKGKSTKTTAADIRTRAENIRLERDAVYMQLTKSRELPLDQDVSFVLDNKQIKKIEISEKYSYTPKNAKTGATRVDHKNQELVSWMKEIIITLKPGESGPYPQWVVHLHYPHKDTEHFTMSHAKRYEDRKSGSSSGYIPRQAIGRDNVNRLLRWTPTA